MDDSPRNKQWWLIATAAVIAVLMLYYYTGSWPIVAILLCAIGAFVIFQAAPRTKGNAHRCLRCGAELNPNARECKSCGSASWTM